MYFTLTRLPINIVGDKLRSQSWGFDLFISSRTPSIEKFKAYTVWLNFTIFWAKSVLSLMKKCCGKFLLRALWRFRVFVTHSKIHEALNFFLKCAKTNRSAKVTRVFNRQIHWFEHHLALSSKASQIHPKYIKLVLTKVNFESKFVFKTELYSVRRSAQIHWITSLSSRSITRSATAGSPFKNFRCHTITNNLFFLSRSWFLRCSVN